MGVVKREEERGAKVFVASGREGLVLLRQGGESIASSAKCRQEGYRFLINRKLKKGAGRGQRNGPGKGRKSLTSLSGREVRGG